MKIDTTEKIILAPCACIVLFLFYSMGYHEGVRKEQKAYVIKLKELNAPIEEIRGQIETIQQLVTSKVHVQGSGRDIGPAFIPFTNLYLTNVAKQKEPNWTNLLQGRIISNNSQSVEPPNFIKYYITFKGVTNVWQIHTMHEVDQLFTLEEWKQSEPR